MKKSILLSLLITICYFGYAQYPLPQSIGADSALVTSKGGLKGRLVVWSFTDTTAANLQRIKDYDGALIKTTTPINALWYRVLDSAKWVQILPTGGGTGGIRAWLDGGNYNVLADGQGNAVFGTLGKNGIKFTTQAIPRFILDSAGILSETGSTIGIGYDPSNGNRLTQYSGGGSGNYLDSFWRVPGIDSNYYRINGVTYAVLDSTGGGGGGGTISLKSPNLYYALPIVGTDSLKDLQQGWGVLFDSSTNSVVRISADSSVVASKDWVGDRLDDYLNITTPRTAWQVFGNHTSGSAAPTWGKLNVNSIDATGTLNSSTVLHGDGTWSTPATGVTTVGSISTSTGIYGAAIITGDTIQLVAANSSSQAGIITTGSQNFFGNKNFQSGITTTNISGSGLANFDIGARFGNYSVSPVTGQVLISSSGNRWIGFHRTSIGAPNGLDFNIGVSGTANYDLVIQRIPTHINNFDGTEVARFTRANGNVLIGTSTDNASALLNISSTSKGFLPPRMTATQAEAIVSPAEGLMIYSTNGSGSTITSKGWWGYDGTTWVKLN